MRQYFCERLNPHFGYFYTVIKSLHKRRTQYQDLEILDTEEFGRVMLLDNITQVVEKNEYLYHEPMVHPACIAHPNPQHICVIGAGDGGIMREVLKHKPQTAVQCELDGEVIEVCKTYLPKVSQGAFDDPHCQLEIGDGRTYIQNNPNTFDIVIMDMTDPFGPSSMLYTKEFFSEIKDSLRDQHGSFVMHCESPIARPSAYQQILKTLSEVYAHQQVLYIYIQMYSVLWSIVISSDSPDAVTCSREDINHRLAQRGIEGLQVYTAESHHSMQVEFPFITSIRQAAGEVPTITDNAHVFLDEAELEAADTPLQLHEKHS
ncbi:MAG: polyamine aminopropyltransferase [Planctomycetes bacterium]|nr:polyamine aminopropyltransferase [Planctomycetota bacterium]